MNNPAKKDQPKERGQHKLKQSHYKSALEKLPQARNEETGQCSNDISRRTLITHTLPWTDFLRLANQGSGSLTQAQISTDTAKGESSIVVPNPLSNAFIRYPKGALVLTLGICLLLWLVGWNFQTRSGIDSVLDARGGQRELYDIARQVGEIDRTVWIDVEAERIFSTETLSLVRELTNSFLSAEHVVTAKSLTHSLMPVRRGFSFTFEPVIPAAPWSEDQLEEMELFSLGHPLIRNVLVSGNGRRTLLAIEYEAEALARIGPAQLRTQVREVLAPFQRDDVRFRILGLPLAELEIRERLTADLIILALGTLLVAGAVLWMAFLNWRLAGLLLWVHLLYLSLLPGLLRLAGYQPEPFAITLFPLLGAIQLTLLAHIGSAYNRARTKGLLGSARWRWAIAETQRSCLFATLTTMAGFLALTVSSESSIRELGLWGAAGVGLGFLFSFGPGLSLLAALHRNETTAAAALERLRTRERFWQRVSTGIALFTQKRSAWLLGGATLLFLATAPGLLLLQPDVRIESFLPRGSQIQEAVLLADAEYGGLQVAQIDFDSGRSGGIMDRDFLEAVWQTHRLAEAIPEVTAVYSYPQVLTLLNQIWLGGGPEAVRLPAEGWLLGMFTRGLEVFDLPLLGALADEERRTAFLLLRMPSVPSARYLQIVEEITAAAKANAAETVNIQAGGVVNAFLASDRAVVRAQVFSSATVAVVVTFLLLVLWRQPRLALTGLAVTALPVISFIGLASYVGMSLNAITVMAGAIAAGVAVDDSVHFITCWREARARLGTDQEAIAEALRIKGPPILWTTIILIGAFLLLGLSSFEPVGQLGFIVAGTLALTLPTLLLVLPCLLSHQQKTHR